jgi:thioredoxin reductase (NADPH)
VRFNTVLTGATGDGRLGALMVHDNATGADDVIECAAAFILIGAEPRTEWLPRDVERDSRGYVVTGLDYQTSLPGVFAAGDVRLGGMKRVAAAVGDGSSAIRFVHEYLAQLRGS